MNSLPRIIAELPLHKQCISKLSVIPPKDFIEFKKEDIEQSITKRFEQQVDKNPNAIAVKSKTETLTYNQLNKAANRLAKTILCQQGETNKATAIAILLEQGASFITAIFGVLKTGNMYVPLDPLFPQTRLTHILENSQAVLILTNNQNLAFARELAGDKCQLLNIDDIDTNISTDNLDLAISPDTPAYIIYTSGSTGKPKGVLQNHRNVLYYSMINTNAMCISPDDRMTLLYSCSVMGAVRCIFNSLLNGASLYPLNIKEEGLANLVNLLIEEEITIYHSVATLFRHFIDTLTGQEQFSKLRVIRLGGEKAVRRDVELYKKHFSANCVMYASLGSTETGTVRHFIIDKNSEINSSSVPIGYPVEDMEILLLNEAGEEVGCGEVGEIVVKSKYLALGYWQNPELTKAVFLPAGESKRLYHTGDLGRMEPDGCLTHMGRKDFQVKIRGFRIEVSEVEMALLDTGAIKEVVVIVREDIPEDKRLVAYIVPNCEPAPTKSELRRYLQDKLPEYMLPSVFVFLNALPLTPNGKIDRLSLPVPDPSKQEQEANFVAPRNDLEQKLSQIWEEVLGIKPIGVRDNFFDLGGHSLVAIKLFAEIEKQFGKQLPLAILFQSGTVEALAKILSPTQELVNVNQVLISDKASTNHKSIDPWSSLVKIQPYGSKPPFFCIHPLGGEILCYRELAMHLGSEQPFYGLQPQGLDGKQPPYTCVEDMASHYIQEIQTIQPHGPYFIGGYSFGGVIAYEIAQRLHRQGEKVGILIMLDTCRPGYWQRLPFLKRVPLHLGNVLQQGHIYFLQKAKGWSQWGKYKLKHKYKRYLDFTPHIVDVAQNLAETDKHLDIMDANMHALSEYVFEVYPGQLTLFRTDDKNRDDAIGVQYDSQFGWGDLVAGGLDIHHVPGSHLSLLQEPHVRVLAEKLKVCLQKADVAD